MEKVGFGVAMYIRRVFGPLFVQVEVPVVWVADRSSQPVPDSASLTKVNLCLMLAATRPTG